jgi:hypothetical protein
MQIKSVKPFEIISIPGVSTHLVERVNLDGGLGDGRQSPLGPLTSRLQPPDGPSVVRDIGLVLPLELGLEVVQKGVVEILSTQVGVTGGGLDGEDSSLDGQEGDIECTTTQVEDEDELLLLGLGVETVGDSGGGRLVDDTEDLESGNGTSVLGSQSLRVVEVGRDAMISNRSVSHLIRFRPVSPTHVTTAFLTCLPNLASATSFILVKTMAEISWGENCFFSLR